MPANGCNSKPTKPGQLTVFRKAHPDTHAMRRSYVEPHPANDVLVIIVFFHVFSLRLTDT